jgi:hypothetical protein
MPCPDCVHYQRCAAPVCPLSDDEAVWFPGEAVCRRADAPEWVGRQRKAARRLRGADVRAFTRAELVMDRDAASGIEGVRRDQTPDELEPAEERPRAD